MFVQEKGDKKVVSVFVTSCTASVSTKGMGIGVDSRR
jgi:hypothetical protein